MSERQRLTTKGRWVVKIGSSLLTNDGQGLNKSAIASWVRQLVQLRQQGVDVILVSSGAVAEGMSRLGWTVRPREVSKLQAAAAVGQMGLVQCWEAAFFEHEVATAQVLLTHDDLSNRKRYLNARSALKTLIELNVVPVINENDTVVTDEIRLGDNDTLGALVVNAVEADALILLTDQQGLFTQDPRKNPNAELIHSARAEDEALEGVAGEGGVLGRGGMVTKVRAARLAARSGAVTVIANGREQDVLMRLALGENVGTCLIPDREPVVARKQWIAGHLQARGILTIDEGAVKALKYQGRSLLAAGVFRIAGDFSRGEMVLIQNELEQVIARGLINYGANDALKIMGRPTRDIETILGYMGEPELIHRDNLVLA